MRFTPRNSTAPKYEFGQNAHHGRQVYRSPEPGEGKCGDGDRKVRTRGKPPRGRGGLETPRGGERRPLRGRESCQAPDRSRPGWGEASALGSRGPRAGDASWPREGRRRPRRTSVQLLTSGACWEKRYRLGGGGEGQRPRTAGSLAGQRVSPAWEDAGSQVTVESPGKASKSLTLGVSYRKSLPGIACRALRETSPGRSHRRMTSLRRPETRSPREAADLPQTGNHQAAAPRMSQLPDAARPGERITRKTDARRAHRGAPGRGAGQLGPAGAASPCLCPRCAGSMPPTLLSGGTCVSSLARRACD